jgi:hypothetical protein
MKENPHHLFTESCWKNFKVTLKTVVYIALNCASKNTHQAKNILKKTLQQ